MTEIQCVGCGARHRKWICPECGRHALRLGNNRARIKSDDKMLQVGAKEESDEEASKS